METKIRIVELHPKELVKILHDGSNFFLEHKQRPVLE